MAGNGKCLTPASGHSGGAAQRERTPTDTSDSTRPAHPSTDEKSDDVIEDHYACLERLEDEFRHADLGIEERCGLEDRVLALRRRLSQ
jgi:hypothetical protein